MKLILALIAGLLGIATIVGIANKFSYQQTSSDPSNQIFEISIGEPVRVNLDSGTGTQAIVSTNDVTNLESADQADLNLLEAIKSGGVQLYK